jgi:hypothetical protein
MFTIRNLGGVALFLFGTTYLWLTPMFAGRGTPTKGILWSIAQVLAFVTLLGFMIATWGLFKKTGWWDGVAITSAVIGLVVLIAAASLRRGGTCWCMLWAPSAYSSCSPCQR